MRTFYLSLWLLLLMLQLGFYFFLLLYRSPVFWVAIPAATTLFYVVSIRGATSVHLATIAIATCVGLLVSWDLLAHALTSPSSDSGAALLLAMVCFFISIALCFGGVALFRRAFFNSAGSR